MPVKPKSKIKAPSADKPKTTTRKRTPNVAPSNKTAQHSIVENIRDGYFETDLTGRITFVNQPMCEIHGYSKEELLHMDGLQFTDRETAQKLFSIFSEVFKTGGKGEIVDYEITRKNGTKRQIEVSALLKKDSSGKPTGFTGITRDITERKRMEEALRRSEERYRGAIEQMQDAYYEVDLAGNYIYVNDAICRFYELPREIIIGTQVSTQRQDEANAKKTRDAFRKVYRTGKPIQSLEVDYFQPDGKTVANYELSVSLIRDAQGRPIGFRGITKNITERKQAEKEREKLIADLQKALSEVKTLSGMLPICSSCKKIRTDKGYWEQIEKYIVKHSQALFSHSLCPDCARELYPEYYDEET